METIRVRFLAEFLNDMVAAERTATAMYRYVIPRCSDDEVRHRLQAQQTECLHHERVLLDLIRDLAGEPAPPASAVRDRLDALEASLAKPAESPLREWLDLEALLEIETRSQRDWVILAKIGEVNGDPAIEKAVGRVGRDEDRHVQALRDAVVSQAPAVMLAR